MLANHGMTRYGFTYDNFGDNGAVNPATTPGATVTAGASPNVESATPLVLATGSNIAHDVYWLECMASNVGGTGDRQMLLDIGVDPAGGTSYTWIISNLVIGNLPLSTQLPVGQGFLFPFLIRAGSQVACRVQCSQSLITARVAAKFFGKPERPENTPVGQYAETIGTITNSQGVGFTPGNAADGSWQSLGTTTRDLWWWQLCYSIANGTITAEATYIDLAWGDGSNKHLIFRAHHLGTSSEIVADLLLVNKNPAAAFCPVPAGATIYVRGRCNNAPDTGYNAVALGIGG